jgi:hypothetical protein
VPRPRSSARASSRRSCSCSRPVVDARPGERRPTSASIRTAEGPVSGCSETLGLHATVAIRP